LDPDAGDSGAARPLPERVPGGPANPLGARALYLYEGNKDTLYRIHGTNQPEYIGQAISSGCIRMTNEDVIDLFDRVKPGATVVVLAPGLADAVRGRVERLRRRRAASRWARYKAAVTLDLRNLGKVVEVDQTSRAALIEGGAYGPSLETSLSRMALRCGIFRRVSNIQPLAAGSRRDRVVISRASTRISTISSKACAW
jgi:hypothetical protein